MGTTSNLAGGLNVRGTLQRSISRTPPSNRMVTIMSHLNEEDKPFLSNAITTAKYGLINFLPKFLFEQFRRYPNVFFLVISILQQINDNKGVSISPTGRYVTIMPLMLVLFITAVKELFEDFKRHKEDKRENNSITLVFSITENK